MNLIFRPGEESGAKERVWEAKELWARVIPILSLLIKDHKCEDCQGRPASRPLCGACSSINGELSEWLSDLLDAMCQAEESED